MGSYELVRISWLLPAIARLAAAQAPITESSLSPAHLFNFEEKVVTNTTLARADPQYYSYFTYPNSTSGIQQPLNGSCKVFPGDVAWPSSDVWGVLDHLLEQPPIKTVPLAHDCYNTAWGGYDADQYTYIASNWNISTLHADDPTSIDRQFWQGRTCLPTGYNVTDTCTIGGYPSYVVNASAVSDIQLAINIARNANIRLVVKNTGHDFAGRSTGAGALSTPASAANPHWRDGVLHACVATSWAADAGAEGVREAFGVLGRWREVDPGGGAYGNEGDVEEPRWQEAFFGGGYERLVGVKREVDPWGVFWAPTTVGGEGWEVRTGDGLATQDGRLCRTG